MNLHEQIKAARKAKDWSQQQLAQAVSEREASGKPLSWQTVQQWENGKSAPKRKRLPIVMQLLGITPIHQVVTSEAPEHPTTSASDNTATYAPMLRPSAPTLAQAVEVLSLHINAIAPAEREAARALLSALVATPAIHPTVTEGLERLCNAADSTPNAAAA